MLIQLPETLQSFCSLVDLEWNAAVSIAMWPLQWQVDHSHNGKRSFCSCWLIQCLSGTFSGAKRCRSSAEIYVFSKKESRHFTSLRILNMIQNCPKDTFRIFLTTYRMYQSQHRLKIAIIAHFYASQVHPIAPYSVIWHKNFSSLSFWIMSSSSTGIDRYSMATRLLLGTSWSTLYFKPSSSSLIFKYSSITLLKIESISQKIGVAPTVLSYRCIHCLKTLLNLQNSCENILFKNFLDIFINKM